MIAKQTKVIMTAAQLIDRAKRMASKRTFYKNKYPYNLCYIHTDGRTSADCVNLYKALFNGYDVTRQDAGYFQRDLSNTGDCTEAELLAQCTDVSQDFSTLQNGVPEVLYMKGHIGGFIGSYYKDNQYYNVVECTGSWGGGILFSWVDSDGTRRRHKGGTKNGKWTQHGKPTKWVKMDSPQAEITPEKPKEDKTPAEDYYVVKRGDILSTIASKYGMSTDEILKLNPQITNPNLILPGQKIYLKKQGLEKTEEIYHTVRKGEVLSGIARRNNTTIKALMELNPAIKDPNLIKTGQKIRIK